MERFVKFILLFELQFDIEEILFREDIPDKETSHKFAPSTILASDSEVLLFIYPCVFRFKTLTFSGVLQTYLASIVGSRCILLCILYLSQTGLL